MSVAHLHDLSGKAAVVTGAGRGIGEGIAHTLAAAGAGVVCAARRAAEIEKVAADIRERGFRAIAVPTDVTDDASVEALAAATVAEFGRLDIWVNNAGGSPVARRLTRLSREDWDAAIAVNLTAVWVCSVIAERHMEDGGAILNISSRAGAQATPGSGHYAAAKAGVDNLTATMAHEVGPRIRVNGIAPGAVPTEVMMKALRLSDADLPELEKRLPAPMGRLGTPEDLGAAALFLVSPASSWITGVTLPVSGGL